jgi:hypothetical protein
MRRFLPPLLLVLSCNRPADDTGTPWSPDLACPGQEACPDADGPLQVGSARRSILPPCWEAWDDVNADHVYSRNTDLLVDCGCDRLCADDPGYPGPDRGEGDGELQTAWMAGFQNGRAMQGVRGADRGLVGEGDGIDARAVVLRQGASSVALVTLDIVGLFFEPDVTALRAAVAAQGVDVDHVVVHSSHNHEGPDTMGLWGRGLGRRGVDDVYQAWMLEQAASAVAEAAGAARPVAKMVVGAGDVGDWHETLGSRNLINDTRDPYIVDERVGVARFEDADGATLATLLSWASHPETMRDDNNLVTSDFVHGIRVGLEQGVSWDARQAAGVGGTALFVNGAVGGMMTPLRIDVEDPDGNVWTSGAWEKADTIGLIVAEIGLDALARGETIADPRLSFRAHRYRLPVDNIGFQGMFLSGVLVRELYEYDPNIPIDAANLPEIATEVAVIEVGPLQLATVPGELLPELLIGGYDGSVVDAPVTVVRADNAHPPDLSAAPSAPYLVDQFTQPHRWLIGLGNDELGYIIPDYDFKLHEDVPYILEAEGDHYEETNSLGPRTAGIVLAETERLLAWSPAE